MSKISTHAIGTATTAAVRHIRSANGVSTHAIGTPTTHTSRFAQINPALALGTTHAGFTIERVERIAEYSGHAYVMRHEATGARLMWLACPDENRTFAISFKTPPADDTGVFHIIEHSVLDGSRRFPTKEPFVHLLKSSMQTFLNAITFPDKTMYPVSSTNIADLENLMDVYLDAVLHPNLYTRRRIFEQEGWHFEVVGSGEASACGELEAAVSDAATGDVVTAADELGDAEAPACGELEAAVSDAATHATPTPAAPTLVYNGVVFNEMKGALSDPDEVLFEALCRQLFPDTAYRFESGGDPRKIPHLTYEGFVDAHARHYQLSNSYIFFYGDLDIERELAFVNDRLLQADARDAGAPNPLDQQVPVMPAPLQVSMATAPENASVAVGYVINTNERTSILALDILLDALMGSNEAPLKRELLEHKLADDVTCSLVDGVLQPILVFQLKGTHEGSASSFREIVEEACAKLVKDGIPREALEASLARAEFSLREHDFSPYGAGVNLAILALSSWLYDDDRSCEYLRYEDALASCKQGLKSSLFETLLDEAVCKSYHTAQVELVAGEEGVAEEEAAELAGIQASLSAADLDDIAREAELLHVEQGSPDTPEAVATLPKLTRADVGSAKDDPLPIELDTPLPCVRHDIPTDHIDHVYVSFGLECLRFEELPYVTVLCNVLRRLNTAAHSASELDMLCERELGRLSFSETTYADHANRNVVYPRLVVGTSVLSDRVEQAALIPQEIWSSTDFDDRRRIRDILQQSKIGIEQSLMGAGHAWALSRTGSYFSSAALCSQQLSGVDYYLFLKELLANFDERADELIGKLQDIAGRIFSTHNASVSFTGSSQDLDRWWKAAGDLSLVHGESASVLVIPKPRVRCEAFAVPGNVCFVSEAMDGLSVCETNGLPEGSDDNAKQATKQDGHGASFELDGSWKIVDRALSYDYLWNRIRKQGGAYGCGFRSTTEAVLQFHSYRDPAVDPTVSSFEEAASWLAAWQPTPEEFDGYVISSVASIDAPETPRAKARRIDGERASKRPLGWMKQLRSQILSADLESVREKSHLLAELAAHRGICVFGGRDLLAASSLDYDIIDLMG